jgi:uncharacterized protein YhdP
LFFSEKAVWADTMNAILFNEPAKIKIQTLNSEQGNVMRFLVNSAIAIPALKKQYNVSIFDSMKGKLNYQAILALPEGNQASTLDVSSDLKNVKINLPEPYGKTKQQIMPVKLRGEFDKAGTYLFLDYGAYLQANLFFDANDKSEGALNKAAFHLGTQKVEAKNLSLPKEDGFWITGNIDEFNWEIWNPVINKYFKGEGTGNTSFLIEADVKKLSIFNQVIEEAQIKVQPTDKTGGLQINVESEKIGGQLNIPADFPKETMVGNFAHFYWPALKDEDSSTESKKINPNLQPNDIPPLHFKVEDFQIGDAKLGQVIIETLPTKKENIVKLNVDIDAPASKAQVEVTWRKRDNTQHTHIKTTSQISDLGSILKNFDITERLVGGRGNINLDLRWADSPLNFNLKKLSGTANVNLSAGTIVGFDEATRTKLDLGKLLNAFSLQSVFQRVSSGFADVRHGGYGFTTWRGTYEFLPGKIESKDMYFDGSVGKIYLKGTINTDERTYDLEIKVIPQYTSSAPALVGFLGGPIIGVAALAVNQIVSMGLDQITGQSYKITGSWDDPQIEKI